MNELEMCALFKSRIHCKDPRKCENKYCKDIFSRLMRSPEFDETEEEKVYFCVTCGRRAVDCFCEGF